MLGWGSRAEADLRGGCTAAPHHNTLSPPQRLAKRRAKIWERLINWLIKKYKSLGTVLLMPRSWLGDRHREGRASPPLLPSPLPELLPHLVHSSCRSSEPSMRWDFIFWAEKITKNNKYEPDVLPHTPLSFLFIQPSRGLSQLRRGRKRGENPTTTSKPQHAPFLLPCDMQPSLGWDKPGCSCGFGWSWGKVGLCAVMTVEVSAWSRVLLLSVGLLAVSVTGKCHGESWQL